MDQVKNQPVRKKRVLVAMSGGVDSSAAAALLVDQGYDVIGVTMQVWDYTSSACAIDEGNGTCCSSTDVDDARAVADKLDIPFYVINCEAKFKQTVIDPFIKDYLDGKTPLPCVNCNTYLKFDHLVRKMRELDCDYLATGHYARIEIGKSGRPGIVNSTDDWKDQTYFLFTIDPELVAKLLFPIGDMKKSDVRAYSEARGLLNARKKDSTGICFVGSQGYSNFITTQVAPGVLAEKRGQVKMHPTGEVLAPHDGIHHFTYGQRKGLGYAAGEPLYVLKIDPSDNTVWVGAESYLFSEKVRIVRTHWLDQIDDGERLKIKIRYAHKGSWARVRKSADNEAHLEFEEPVRAVTPGQAAVMYRDNLLVGGGWIV